FQIGLERGLRFNHRVERLLHLGRQIIRVDVLPLQFFSCHVLLQLGRAKRHSSAPILPNRLSGLGWRGLGRNQSSSKVGGVFWSGGRRRHGQENGCGEDTCPRIAFSPSTVGSPGCPSGPSRCVSDNLQRFDLVCLSRISRN